MKKTKKTVMLLGVALILALVMALMAGPAMASTPKVIDTDATITGDDTGGSPPIIKGKWEKFHHPNGTDPASPHAASVDFYDDDPVAGGMQVFPPGEADKQGIVDVEFWAVVTDPQGTDDIQFVYADVYHPAADGSAAQVDFKYEVMLLQVCCDYLDPGVRAVAIAEMTAADAAGAITYGDIPADGTYTLDDLIHQYEKGEAKIYMGHEVLDYHQPWGWYTVEVCAADQALEKDYLVNTFEYVKTVGFMLDFSAINFGEIKICKEKIVSGDDDMTTPGEPTIKNLGNCAIQLWVHFDDMGFGKRTEASTEVWNVHYDVRLDLDDPVYCDPCEDAEVPGILERCETEQLSFSIHVDKAEPGYYYGILTITAEQAPHEEPA